MTDISVKVPRPAVIDSAHFRRVLSHLATGVTVVTAYGKDGMVGMSCNSVTSVSLEPALVSVCPALSSSTWPLIRETGGFCINVLGASGEQLGRQFARSGIDRFAGVSTGQGVRGPRLSDALAWIECEIAAEHQAGDHTIAVGSVLDLEVQNEGSDPLVFFMSSFGTFARD